VDFIIWLLLAMVYLALLVTVGLIVLRKGHTILFFVGIFVPLVWIAAVFLPPTSAASTAAARANLR
jgi:hypothetical protein